MPTIPGTGEDETTSVRIRLSELQARHREHRQDLGRIDQELDRLEKQVARIDERMRHVQRFLRVATGILAALIASGVGSVIKIVLSQGR